MISDVFSFIFSISVHIVFLDCRPLFWSSYVNWCVMKTKANMTIGAYRSSSTICSVNIFPFEENRKSSRDFYRPSLFVVVERNNNINNSHHNTLEPLPFAGLSVPSSSRAKTAWITNNRPSVFCKLNAIHITPSTSYFKMIRQLARRY